MRYQWLVWPLFAAVMGFALGGSFVWGLQDTKPSYQADPTKAKHQHVEAYEARPNNVANEHPHEGSQKGKWYDTFLNHTPDWFVAAFTALLTFVTYRLVTSTNKLWEAGERQIALARETATAQSRETRRSIAVAERAADAAMLNARAAIGIELPFLRIDPAKFGNGATRGNDGSLRYCFYVAEIIVSNSGRTKAIPITIEFGWTFGAELPPEPEYRWDSPFKVDAVIEPAPAEPVAFWLHGLEMEVPANALEQLTKGDAKFWFYARLTYLDFMGARRMTCMCWRRAESPYGPGQTYIDDTTAYNRKT